ncbi:hypothetical protein NDU88_005791 [Pleurodeles waltl]|uniref:Uncharacterized protein n=1 Tax=Pleurodeles waltl TaxID=8319 RepID=A0AAV7LMF2_PLEWA|nr:hypothetical protein NDU88_005791 [Pleurodeles waltl]
MPQEQLRLSLLSLRRKKKNPFRKGPSYQGDLAESRADHRSQGPSLTDTGDCLQALSRRPPSSPVLK